MQPPAAAVMQPPAQRPAPPDRRTPVPVPPVAPSPSSPPPPQTEPAPEPAALDAAALRRLWPEVLDVIGASSRTIRALLESSQVVDASANAVTLSVAASLAKRLTEERNTAAIAAGLNNVVGGTWKVTVQPAGPRPDAVPAPGRAAAPPQPEPDPRDDDEPDAADAAAPVDPQDAAVQLLRSELGARPLER